MRDPAGKVPRLVGVGTLVLMSLMLFVPFTATVVKSFQAHDLAQPHRAGQFVGMANYRALLASEPEFRSSLGATGTIVAGSVVQSAAAFLLALWTFYLWPKRLPTFLAAMFVLPMLLSPTLVALMGRFFLNDQIGPAAKLLMAASPGASPPLTTPWSAFLWISVLDAWQWVPLETLLFWLCLRAVPRSELEVSRIDGLGKLTVLRDVIFARVGAFLGAVVLIRTLAAVSLYDIPHVLTGGGPGTSTMTISLYANRLTFGQHRFGLAAAQLVLVYALTGLLVAVLVRQAATLRNFLRGVRK